MGVEIRTRFRILSPAPVRASGRDVHGREHASALAEKGEVKESKSR